MRNIAVRDENFDIRSTSSYHLSIQYGERFFSFAILDLLTLKYIVLKNLWFPDPVSPENQAEHLRLLLNADNYLLRSYHRVYFMYHNPLSVLVPDALFISGEKETYFKYSGQPGQGDIILERSMRNVSARQLFPVPETVYQFLTGTFDNLLFFHQSIPLIDTVPSETKPAGRSHRVFLSAGGGYIDLALFGGGQLVFYNSFKAKNPEDLVFFVLYLYDQFGLLQEETPLEISGFIEFYPGAPEMLKKYIRMVSLSGFTSSFNYSYTFKTLAVHQFTPLINLYHCG